MASLPNSCILCSTEGQVSMLWLGSLWYEAFSARTKTSSPSITLAMKCLHDICSPP